MNLKRILCYGDSLTAGTSGSKLFPYPLVLLKALSTIDSTIQVHHVGLPGCTAWQMLEYKDNYGNGLNTLLGSVNPELVILLAGTNDLGYYPATEISQNVQALHSLCHSKGAKTLAVGIPPSYWVTVDDEARAKKDSVNQELLDFCSTGGGKDMSTFVPFPFEFENGGKNWHPDGLHFSEEGYNELGNYIADIVKRAI